MLACPRCGEVNPEQARFCLKCGTPLAGAAGAPSELRKIITVVFCDLAGSTTLGEQLDPESLRRVISRYFDTMRQAVERHGGTVEKFIGDAVMAVFGVPEAHEDDALRALVSAADMRAELDRLNTELSERWGVRLECRIGVNTGEVLTGEPGAAQAFVTGDAVNVAARLEQVAEPGQILLGRTTYQLTRDAIRAEPVTPLQLKGKAAAVPAYRLLEVFRDAPGRTRRLDVPLVGRGRELDLIKSAYRRAVDQRSCQLITVVGEAGVGKSRLVAEMADAVYEEATVIAARCPEYGEGMTFWPAAEAVREAAGLSVKASRDEALARFRRLLEPGEHTDAVTERLAELIGVGDKHDGVPAPVDELAWAVRKLFEAVATGSPLFVVFEDLHWAEPTFLDLVDHVITWSRQAPIVIVGVGRPELFEQRPWWNEQRPNSLALHLEPLSPEESGLLVQHLLGGRSLPETVRDWLTRTTEGNPLFVEETLAMLVDEGVLRPHDSSSELVADVSTLRVPTTLESLLIARIDQLESLDETALLRASVIGKVFGTAALSALSPPADRPGLAQAIARLSRRDLIEREPAGFLGGEAFTFHHALLRDAAYGMLTKEQRAELHERFAGWLERAAGEWAVEYDELLAYHLEAAYGYRQAVGLVDEHDQALAGRAVTKLVAAGRRALAREDARAAVRFLSRARDLVDAAHAAPADGSVSKPVVLHELGRALMAAGRLAEAASVLEEAHGAALGADERRIQLEIEISRLALALQTEASAALDTVSERTERAVAELEQMGDHAGLARAWHLMASVEWMRGTGASEQALERAVEHARAAGDDHEEAVLLSNMAGAALFGLTPVETAIRRCEQALAKAQAGQRPILEAWALRTMGGMRAMQGDFEAARQLVIPSTELFEDLGQPIWTAAALQVLGMVEELAGDGVASERALRQSYLLFEREGHPGWLSYSAALLARVLYELGRDDEAEEMTEVSERSGPPDDSQSQMLWRAVRAKILARRGEVEEAERLARDAEQIGRGTEMLLFADVLMDVGEVLEASSRRDQAATAVREALAMYESKGNVPSASRARERLTTLTLTAEA